MKKFLSIFLTCTLIFTSLSTLVMADNSGFEAGTNPGGTDSNVTAADQIMGKGTQIVNAILWCGYAVALGMVVFIGIKYILGSAEAKSNMKSAIVSWFIGAFIVFMCTTIVGWVMGVIGAGDSGLAGGIIDAADSVK